MKIAFIIIGAIVLLILGYVVYRLLRVKWQSGQLNAKRFARVKSLYDLLESGEGVTQNDVLPFAENRLTREMAFQLLVDHGKTHLFPEAFHTIVAAAESNLANWLEFPTELGACPDEIEHLKRVTIDFDGQQNYVHYEVFKYRMHQTHWAAKDGWILGVVGPYFDDSKPYDFPHATFSRIDSTVASITAEEEAKWVHENISMR